MSVLPSHGQDGNIWHWGMGKAEKGIYLRWLWAQGSKFSIILSLKKPAGSTSVPAVTLMAPSVGEQLSDREREENKSLCAVVTCRAVWQQPSPAAPECAQEVWGPAVAPLQSPSPPGRCSASTPHKLGELEAFSLHFRSKHCRLRVMKGYTPSQGKPDSSEETQALSSKPLRALKNLCLGSLR